MGRGLAWDLWALVVWAGTLTAAEGANQLRTSTADSGPGTLRQAILASVYGDVVGSRTNGIVQLLSELAITNQALSIRGPGPTNLTVHGGAGFAGFGSTGPHPIGDGIGSSGLGALPGKDLAGGSRWREGDGHRDSLQELGAQGAQNPIIVSTAEDDGPGSLRQALRDVLENGTVRIEVDGAIVLSSGPLVIAKSLQLVGPGMYALTLVGPAEQPSIVITNSVVRLVDFSLQGSGAASVGIVNEGELTLTRIGFRNHSGNALLSHRLATVEDCVFDNNWGDVGSAIHAGPGSTLRAIRSVFGSNSTLGGGAVYQAASASNLVLEACVFYGNSALENSGGALLVQGPAYLTNCTFHGNSASAFGGAIATEPLGATNHSATLVLVNCTLSGNSASSGGGLAANPGEVRLRNTIVARNSAGIDPDLSSNTARSDGHNLIGSPVALLDQRESDRVGLDPMLGPFQFNGSPLLSQALLPGSPAIDAADKAGSPDTDQRGFPRPANGSPTTGGPDIGAVEVQPPSVLSPGDLVTLEDTPLGPFKVTVTDPESEAETLVVTVLTSNPVLLPPANIILGGTGATRALTLIPAADVAGTAEVTLTAVDEHGTATSVMFKVTVTSQNDPPAITAPPGVTVLEDIPAPLAGFSFADVDAGTNALTATFEVDSGTLSAQSDLEVLVDGRPLIARLEGTITALNRFLADGRLTFLTATDFTASVSLTVTIDDAGASGEDGITNVGRTNLAISVTPVNDAPFFTKGPDQTVGEGAGPQTVVGWATDIGPGPVDESKQTLTFELIQTNSALFATPPALSPAGTLTYTPAANAIGTAAVTVVLRDNGGTANGGVDASTDTFLVTVTPVNEPPILTAIPAQRTAAGNRTLPIQIHLDDPDAGDLEQLRLVGSSADPLLVSEEDGFEFRGSGPNWLLTIQPQPNQTGTVELTVTAIDPAGATASVRFPLEVYNGPQILTQPVGWTVEVGATASLDVRAKSAAESDPTYQWYKDSVPVAGATNPGLSFAAAQLPDSGDYQVVVGDQSGNATSRVARFTVQLPSRPVVPAPVVAWEENHRLLTISVAALGEPTLSYQWFRNGVALTDRASPTPLPLLDRGRVSGAMNARLTIADFQPADAGIYLVRVGNAEAVVESPSAQIPIVAYEMPMSDHLAGLRDPQYWLPAPSETGAIQTRKARTRGFSNEKEEPLHADRPGGSSGWVVWRPEATGVAAFTSSGSGFDTLLAVYQLVEPNEPLTFRNLRAVTGDDDGGGFLTSHVQFNAERGAVYAIAFDDRAGQGGDLVMRWGLIKPESRIPVIESQPVSLAVRAGDPPGQIGVTMENGRNDGLGFGWRRNGVPLEEGVEGFRGVSRPILTILGWDESKVARYTVLITDLRSDLSVESEAAVVELISGDASSNYTARPKRADVFLRPNPRGLRPIVFLPVPNRGIHPLGPSTSAGTILTPGGQSGSMPPEECGLGDNPVWRVATDMFPPNAFVVVEAVMTDPEPNPPPFTLSLWTSECADPNAFRCLATRQWACAPSADGISARLGFVSAPGLHYVLAVNAGSGSESRIKFSWQTEDLTTVIPADGDGWVVIDIGSNSGLRSVYHVSIQSDPGIPPVTIGSNAPPARVATRFWFPVLADQRYALKLDPASYTVEKLHYTTKVGRPEIEVATGDRTDRWIRLRWDEDGVSLQSTTRVKADWQHGSNVTPTSSGPTKELHVVPGDAPFMLFRLVPDP